MIRSRLRRAVTALWLIGAAGFGHGAYADTGDAVVVVGASLLNTPLSNGFALLIGARLAVEELNRGGGLLGRRLRIIPVDDVCDARQAEMAAEQAVIERPVVVIGHNCSRASIAAAPIYAHAGILQISPSSTNPHLTQLGIPTLFRMIGRDDGLGEAIVDRIARRWRDRRIALLGDSTIYGQGLAAVVRAGLASNGIGTVGDQT